MSAGVPPSSTGSVKLDALKNKAIAADPTKPSGIDLYSRFAFAGAVCCAVTHGGFTPVDVYVSYLDATLAHPSMAVAATPLSQLPN